jgi:hypothetical protein
MIQKGGNYMFLHTYTFTIDIVPLILEDQCFAEHVQEYGWIMVKMHHQRKRNADPLKGNRRRPIQLIQPGQAPLWQRPRTSHEAVVRQASRRCTRTAPGAARPTLTLAVAWWHAMTMQGGFLIYLHPNRPHSCINIGVELTHHTWVSLPPLVSFTILVVLLSKASFIGELKLLGANLVWIIWRTPLCSCSHFYQYSYVMKLEQSSYVIYLAYKTLCLIYHTIYMFRPGPKLR